MLLPPCAQDSVPGEVACLLPGRELHPLEAPGLAWRTEAGLYIPFDEPVRCRPLSSDLLQCCMATAVWPESVTGILEVRSIRAIVDRFEDHVHALLYDLIPCGRDAEFPHLAIRFRDIDRPHWLELELFGLHLLNDGSYRGE